MPKIKFLRKVYNHLFASAEAHFERNADVEVQLRAALAEDKSKHFTLRNQAAQVLAEATLSQKRAEKTENDIQAAYGETELAIKEAELATNNGDELRAQQFNAAATALALRIANLESQLVELKAMAEASATAAEGARLAVQHSADLLTTREQEISQLVTINKTAELAKTVASISESMTGTGENSNIDAIRAKVERNYEVASARVSLASQSSQGTQLAVEATMQNLKAEQTLSAIKDNIAKRQLENKKSPKSEK